MNKRTGFTLMEMIGVMAVMAILVSVATPMIFDAMRTAKITSFVEEVNVVKTAVAAFYEDTGDFPTHVPTDKKDSNKQLLKNNPTKPISGWDGPYLEKEFDNPFSDGGYRGVLLTNRADYQFDLDGDGAMDTTEVVVIRVDGVSDNEAKEISDILDDDGSETSGSGSWKKAGRVKRLGGDHKHSLLIYLSKA